MPPAEIETIYLFQPLKREGREWGTAVVTRREEGGDRLRVYTARYMLIVRGKERGRWKADVEEVALTPAEVLAQVMQAMTDRTGDPEPPVAVERSAWYEG
jgi:sirohydrochlorin ferrochelatase